MGTEWALSAVVDRGVGTDFPYFPSRRLSDCGRRYRALGLWLPGWTALCFWPILPSRRSISWRGASSLPWGVDGQCSCCSWVPQPSRSWSSNWSSAAQYSTAQHSTAPSLPFTVVCSGCVHFSRSVAAPQGQRNNPAPKTR